MSKKNAAIRSGVITLDPPLAKKFLSKMRKNRKVSENVVQHYAQTMLNGEYKVTHQGIAFDTDGNLVDGQHRCLAVVKSGCTVQIMKTDGLPTDAFDYIDRGKKRVVGDVLSIDGEKASRSLASLLAKLWHYRNHPDQVWAGRIREPTIGEIRQTLDDNPNVRMIIEKFRTRLKQVGSNTDVLLCLYLFWEVDEDDGLEFGDKLCDGTDLKKGDPILALRNRFINLRAMKQHISPRERIGMTLKAWNAWRRGDQIRALRFTTQETFPVLI
jgi:hypothetical protein